MGTGILKRKEVRKRNKAKHKKMGICIYCSKKSIEDETMCEYHKEYHRQKRLNSQSKARTEEA